MYAWFGPEVGSVEVGDDRKFVNWSSMFTFYLENKDLLRQDIGTCYERDMEDMSDSELEAERAHGDEADRALKELKTAEEVADFLLDRVYTDAEVAFVRSTTPAAQFLGKIAEAYKY